MIERDRISRNSFVDPDDAPELTKDWFERGDLYEGGKLVRRGRPASKESVSIRLSPDVLAHFRAGGRGWETRIDAALREVVKGSKRS